MGIFKKKDKTPPARRSFVGPTDKKPGETQVQEHDTTPELKQESSDGTFDTAPTNNDRVSHETSNQDRNSNAPSNDQRVSNAPSVNDRDSNISNADTKVTQQRDAVGNRQTVVTTTTTTTTTTVTSDGRVFTEQHANGQPPSGVSELPANSVPRPPSPQKQLPPQQSQGLLPSGQPTPPIPSRHERRRSQPEANMLQPPPSMPAQSQNNPVSPVQQQQQQHQQYPPPHDSPVSPQQPHQDLPACLKAGPPSHQQPQQQQRPTSQSNPLSSHPPPSKTPPPTNNFSRPNGRRANLQSAAVGIHGMGEGLRGAINARAGVLLGDDAATVAKNKEIRDKGIKEARESTFVQRIGPFGRGGGEDDGRKRLRRQSGERGVAKNF